jgi:hypothetical protein
MDNPKFTKEEYDKAVETAYAELNYYALVEEYKYKTPHERLEFMCKIQQIVRRELGISDKVERTFHLTRLKLQDLK